MGKEEGRVDRSAKCGRECEKGKKTEEKKAMHEVRRVKKEGSETVGLFVLL